VAADGERVDWRVYVYYAGLEHGRYGGYCEEAHAE
jgi:hypothetical protein